MDMKDFQEKYRAMTSAMMDEKINEIKEKHDAAFDKKLDELINKFRITLHVELNELQTNFDSIKIILLMLEQNDFHKQPTNEIYNTYQELCEHVGLQPILKTVFTKFINKWFDYTVIDKKINGVKYRLFEKINVDAQEK